MKVKICDALPGMGKTSACINMMNSNTKNKYIFVTQYLSEVDRIKTFCKERNFISPEATKESGFTKISDIYSLILNGENIATTHALFTSYNDDIKEAITKNNYILILDEVVDVLTESRLSKCDVEILKRSEMLKEDDVGFLNWTDDDLDDDESLFKEEIHLAKSKNFFQFQDEYFCWSIPPDLFKCFSDVYVLTYLFYGQNLRCFFNIYNIEYEYVGVHKQDDVYEFCSVNDFDRSIDLREKIHILNNDRMNNIGNKKTALSYSWYNRAMKDANQPDIDKLKKNINNVFRNIWKIKSNDNMWSVFKNSVGKVRGKGFWNSYVPYNKRASNEYADRRYLAYCVNIFPRPWEISYYKSKGADINGDAYALSTMVQWIFRSAIRKGEEIWIYIPSNRMRYILNKWIENLNNGTDLNLDDYNFIDKDKNNDENKKTNFKLQNAKFGSFKLNKK